jgi:hypothetical protein
MDDYTLAAFMAGTLPDEARAEVVRFLASNADGRELLRMSDEAMEAAEGIAPIWRPLAGPARGASRWHSLEHFVRSPARYALAACFLVAVGLSLHLGVPESTERLRADGDGPSVVVRVETRGPLQLRWSTVQDAVRYRIVVWDATEASLVGEIESVTPRLDAGHASIREIEGRLVSGRTYSVRVDAIDGTNRVVVSSPLEAFTWSRPAATR